MAHGQDDVAPEPDESHVSPDGALTLHVFYGDDPALGFAGSDWHVHGGMYPGQGAPRDVISAWAADILSGRRPIVECLKDGVRVDLWTPETNTFDLTSFLEADDASRDPAEEWRLRSWTG